MGKVCLNKITLYTRHNDLETVQHFGIYNVLKFMDDTISKACPSHSAVTITLIYVTKNVIVILTKNVIVN